MRNLQQNASPHLACSASASCSAGCRRCTASCRVTATRGSGSGTSAAAAPAALRASADCAPVVQLCSVWRGCHAMVNTPDVRQDRECLTPETSVTPRMPCLDSGRRQAVCFLCSPASHHSCGTLGLRRPRSHLPRQLRLGIPPTAPQSRHLLCHRLVEATLRGGLRGRAHRFSRCTLGPRPASRDDRSTTRCTLARYRLHQQDPSRSCPRTSTS